MAYRLIAERGLEGFRFADVAREAGINNGTLLYYFPSKDALVQAVGAYLVEQFSEPMLHPDPDADGAENALAELRREFDDARLRLHQRVGVVFTELLVRAQRDPSVAALMREIEASWCEWLVTLLERGRASGQLRADIDVDLVASAIMSAILGVGMQALIRGSPSGGEPLMDAFADLISAWVAAA